MQLGIALWMRELYTGLGQKSMWEFTTGLWSGLGCTWAQDTSRPNTQWV